MTDHERLHDDEIEVNEALVGRLVAEQFPELSHLPVRRVASSGTVNAIFRLGDDLVIRIPRAESYVWRRYELDASHDWLRQSRPSLPLAIPEGYAIGEPSDDYPWPWPIHRWIAGRALDVLDLSDSNETATRLGAFVNALHDLPRPGPDAPRSVKAIGRSTWDAQFRQVVEGLHGLIDVRAALDAWDETLEVPSFDGAPVWVHADLLPGNLLARDGGLHAVLDFECLGSGDRALDLTPAWTVFSASARTVFRQVVPADDATWQRARNFALRAVMGVRYYETTNPRFSALSLRTIRRVLEDRS